MALKDLSSVALHILKKDFGKQAIVITDAHERGQGQLNHGMPSVVTTDPRVDLLTRQVRVANTKNVTQVPTCNRVRNDFRSARNIFALSVPNPSDHIDSQSEVGVSC